MTSLLRKARAFIAAQWRKWWPALRPALVTAGMTFVGIFGASFLGWVDQVVDWMQAPDAVTFPDTSILARAAISAASASAAGLLNFVVRAFQLATGRTVVGYSSGS